MILALVIFILILGGILCLATVRGSEIICRWIALLSVGIDLVLVVFYWISNYKNIILLEPGSWLLDFKKEWIPQWGISFHLALDGLSLILVVLTLFLGVISILVSWQQIKESVRFFHCNILWIIAGL
jgi:NADH-quinone oxidoreductase subunit M